MGLGDLDETELILPPSERSITSRHTKSFGLKQTGEDARSIYSIDSRGSGPFAENAARQQQAHHQSCPEL